MVTQLSRWDNVGTEAPAGDAEYVSGQQPIAEWDNYFNWSAAKDVENLIAALENIATGHDHDGVNSKAIDGGDVVNTPAGDIAASDVQAAINELDTDKIAKASFDANTIVKADSDDTPAALTVAEQTIVGRITAGVITALTATQVRTLLNVTDGANVTPVGSLFPYGGAVAPSGYVLCDGAAISRATYADLFAVISTSYGVGDGSTTFNVPDMQGNIPVGIGASGVTNLGDAGGEQEHTLSVAEMPEHAHDQAGDTTSGSSGNFRLGTGFFQGYISSEVTGDGDGHNNMQPYVGVNYIIKT